MTAQPELKILREEDLQDKICVVIGTRPGIVMFSPILRELKRRKLDFVVIHTGQHYSYNMDRKFFEDLKLEEPHYKLDTVQFCAYHGEQTAEMLKGCEQVLLKEKPKVVLVGGDANTNLAGALAARKLRIRVGHVEAGERSGDWRMPEEHNRIMIDHISDYLFTTNAKGRENLIQDHVRGQILITGNPIVDAAHQNLELAKEKSRILEEFGLTPGEYFVLTLHREENVDSKGNLSCVLEGIQKVCEERHMRIVFLAHPRTQKRLKEFGLEKQAQSIKGLEIKDAIGYLDFLMTLANARLALTDSGGVQQESCILHVPCVTLRENTEWTETLDIGANTLTGTDPCRIVQGAKKMLKAKREWEPPFGDGKSARNIIDALEEDLGWR